jgi:hypothetical protein
MISAFSSPSLDPLLDEEEDEHLLFHFPLQKEKERAPYIEDV